MKNILKIVFLVAGFWSLSPLAAFSQTIDTAEYFFDTDPGVGNGVTILVTPGDTVNDTSSISTAGLAPGFHFLFIRVRDTNHVWSLYEGERFLVYDTLSSTAAFDSSGGEYFFNTDPGVRNGIALTVAPSDTISDTLLISTAGLASGFHNFFFRAKDSNNVWSLYEGSGFYLFDTIATQQIIPPIYTAEYFYDTDPGIGLGTALPAFAAGDSILLNDTLPSAPLTAGTHNLFVRVRDSLNKWSLYEGSTFVICNFIPVPDFTADTVCQNASTSFTDLSTNLDTANHYTYAWDFNGDGITDDTTRGNTSHTFTAGGTYTVTLIVNNTSGCVDTVVKTVYVDSLPIVTFTLTIDTLCKFDTLVLAGGLPAGGTYTGPGVFNGIFYSDSTTTGNKTITYTYTNSDSCTATATDIIHVNPCTGINELAAYILQINVSPNPFHEAATLEIIDPEFAISNLTLHLYDVFGKEIRKTEINSERSEIARGSLSGGIYFFKITYIDKMVGTGKLVVAD